MDYEQNPSNLDSGSIIVVHQDSSLLDDIKEKLSDIAYNIKRRKKDEWMDFIHDRNINW